MRLLKRLMAAIAVGFGMIFASRAREQHWSESPSVLVEEAHAEDEAGEP